MGNSARPVGSDPPPPPPRCVSCDKHIPFPWVKGMYLSHEELMTSSRDGWKILFRFYDLLGGRRGQAEGQEKGREPFPFLWSLSLSNAKVP